MNTEFTMKKDKKSNKPKFNLFQYLTDGPVCWYDWLILILLAGFCFLTYEMRDLYHTAGCSYGYLDGHIFSFYDYLAESGIGEDGTVGLHAAYMPTVYLLFAIWNLPMKIFGIVPHASAQLSLIPIMWAKLLPCLVFIAGGPVVYQIGTTLKMREHKAKLLMYAYLSAPVALFGQFILGQYESFMVFCVLLGVYFWLKRKNIPFIACFAVAMTFKYTALIFFLPLLMLREKRIFRIIFSVAAVFVVFILEFAIYMHSPVFMNYAFGIGSAGDNPTGYVTNAQYFTGFALGEHMQSVVYLAVIAFAFTVAYAYFKQARSEEEEGQYAMYVLCLSGAALFCFSKWHPHWLMICIPFWTVSAFMHRNTKIFMALDLLFMALFVMFCTGAFVHVTDEVMLECGIFKYLLPGGHVSSQTAMSEYLCKIDSSMLLSLLTAMIAVFALFKHPRFMLGDVNNAADGSIGWIRARYILGLLIFILPSLLVLKDSVHGKPTAYLEENRAIFVEAEEIDGLKQAFTAEGTGISKLKFPVSIGDNSYNDRLYVRIEDAAGTVLYDDDFSCGNFYEGQLVLAKPHVELTSGETYYVVFTLDAKKESSFCLLAAPEDGQHENAASADGVKAYHLDMNIYQ